MATPDRVTPLFASGLSNLMSPPPLSLPPVRAIGIALPSEGPIPTGMLCVGIDGQRRREITAGSRRRARPRIDAIDGDGRILEAKQLRLFAEKPMLDHVAGLRR